MSGDAPFQAPVGTHDVLAPAAAQWEAVIGRFATLAHRYGFSLIVNPTFEDVGVFVKGIGESSEVFSKEMYVFTDRGERTYALRPEGTASVVRAFIQHRPTTPYKAWYLTPAFRYERPQAGRYREHHQVGVEALGTSDPALDVEVITLAQRFYESIGLRSFQLLVNSMGDENCRPDFVAELRDYLSVHASELCEEHATAWSANPLRVLDCKRESCVAVTEAGPRLVDRLCDECAAHFAAVRQGLATVGVEATLAPRLVRGFDYYTRTTFEFASDALAGAQNAIGGGGRYDRLVATLGGPETPGIGFGSGLERLLLARAAEGLDDLASAPLVAFVVDTSGADAATALVARVRDAGLSAERAYDGRSMKAQMKAADRSGALFALVVGPEERAHDRVTIRDLRSGDFDQTQRSCATSDVVATLVQLLADR